ncbi:MAG: nucleotidyl transferase AbiEii/AbiGii toxin family protein [Thermoguttaceae bacterium]
MKLHEHPDFEQAIIRAAEHFAGRGLRESIIEKDYYVTEALRIIAQAAGKKAIFKGGTSLSKGWNLIQRFSEDIDLFLDPLAFQRPLGKKAIDRELKKLRDAIAGHPALTFLPQESKTIGGFGRSDSFAYVQKFGGPGEVANRVLLEVVVWLLRKRTTVRNRWLGEQSGMGHETRVSQSVRAVVQAQDGKLLCLRQALEEMLKILQQEFLVKGC